MKGDATTNVLDIFKDIVSYYNKESTKFLELKVDNKYY
jgi:hypothetical protein